MSEADEIAQARRFGPESVRELAGIARDPDADSAARSDAISSLVARRFLTTHRPSDDDLRRIERMTDAEIQTILSGSFH